MEWYCFSCDIQQFFTVLVTFGFFVSTQSLVTHNFVIGSRYDAEDLAAIRRLGISYVLNITDRIPNYFPDVLIYHRIDIQGMKDVYVF